MAPPKAIFTAIAFLFLFTVGHARIQLDLHPSIDVSGASILLPSEKHDPAQTVVKLQPKLPKESVDQDFKGLDSEAQSSPLTVVRFRPINRRFTRRPLIQLRHGQRCHHFRRFNGREIPYGNDMILSTTGRDDMGVDQTQPKWSRFRYDAPKFAYMSRMDWMRWRLGQDRHHHHHHDVDDEKEELELKKIHKHKGGFFLRKLRKFLKHF